MEVHTLRFGTVEIESDDTLHFPAGLLGLEDCRDWAVLTDPTCTAVAWLQSIDRPEVALAVVSPRRFVSDYQMRVARRELEPLALDSPEAAGVLAIVGKTDRAMTLNLKAPLVINLQTRTGRQVMTNGELPVQYQLGSTSPTMKRTA